MYLRFGGSGIWENYSRALIHEAIFTDRHDDRWYDIGPVAKIKVGRYQLTIRKCLDQGCGVEHRDMSDGHDGSYSWSNLVSDNDSNAVLEIWPDRLEGAPYSVRLIVPNVMALQAIDYFTQTGGLRDPTLPWGVYAHPDGRMRLLTVEEIRSTPAGKPITAS
jgi:hypothetical protein